MTLRQSSDSASLMSDDGTENGTIDEGSVVTKSTNMVTDVQAWVKGSRGVVVQPAYLVSLVGLPFNDAVNTLYEKASTILQEIEAQLEGQTVTFTIGKALLLKHKSHKHISSTAVKTWTLSGVLSRWKAFYSTEGYAGLVVLGAVTNVLCKGTHSFRHVFTDCLLLRAWISCTFPRRLRPRPGAGRHPQVPLDQQGLTNCEQELRFGQQVQTEGR